MTLNKKDFIEMLRLQYSVNDIQSSQNWITGFNQYNLYCDWLRALRMECFEACQCFQFKFWKSAEKVPQYTITDKPNLKIELVDMWHFILAEIIFQSIQALGRDDLLTSRNSVKYLELMESQEFINFNRLLKEFSTEEFKTSEALFTSLEEFVSVRTYDKLVELLPLFLRIVYVVFSDEKEPLKAFYQTYVNKATLNKFRGLNGYIKGTYKKTWHYNGKDLEDNYVVTELAKDLVKSGTYSSEKLYERIREVYRDQ